MDTADTLASTTSPALTAADRERLEHAAEPYLAEVEARAGVSLRRTLDAKTPASRGG
jgi:hypothetical protein